MENKQMVLFDYFDDALSLAIEGGFQKNESYDLEYKSAQGGFPKEFWKSYSAFANTNAGLIVLGIKEIKGALVIEGLSDDQTEAYKKQFWDECNNPNKVSINLLDNNDVRIAEYQGKKLLVFRIPFAGRTQRPVYLTKNPFGNTFKRNHEGDYCCTDDEVKRMLADSSTVLKRDSLILEHYSIKDLDQATIVKYRQLLSVARPSHPWNALNDEELLTKLGGFRKDRQLRIEGITLAGLLMFGKEDSIREQEEILPNFFPEFREKLSQDKSIRWTDRIYPDGTWEPNLLQFYLRVWPKLSSSLPKPFKLDNDQRVDETPAHVALREAFVNTLVHTDYSLNGNIIVEQDADQFVFSNPGTLLVSVFQYYSGGVSECRNPGLQRMFMMIGRAEKAGSGVDKIMAGWDSAHWRRPFIDPRNNPDRVILFMPLFSVIPDNILNELSARFGSVADLSPDELTVLYYCLVEGVVTNQRLQFTLNLHKVDITGLLKKLCERGFLESDSNGRWTLYTLKGDSDLDTSDSNLDTSDSNLDTSGSNLDTSGPNLDTSDADSENATDGFKKLKRNDLEKVIMQICKVGHVSIEQIAKSIGKSERYLKNEIIPGMVKKNMLEKLFPHTSNHPNQAYKTTDECNEEL